MSADATRTICWWGIASLCVVSIVRIGYRLYIREAAKKTPYERLLPLGEPILLFPIPFLLTFVYNILVLIFLSGAFQISLAVVFSLVSLLYLVFFVKVYQRISAMSKDGRVKLASTRTPSGRRKSRSSRSSKRINADNNEVKDDDKGPTETKLIEKKRNKGRSRSEVDEEEDVTGEEDG